jgi:hypothetical protein
MRGQGAADPIIAEAEGAGRRLLQDRSNAGVIAAIAPIPSCPVRR